MTEFVKGFVCAERTADGPRHFAVDCEETFDAYVELSDMGSDEAGAWGGFDFDLDPDDEENGDADGDDMDQNELVKCQVITMAEIKKASAAHINNINSKGSAAHIKGNGYDSPYEDAFLAVRDGDFRE